MFLTSKNFIKNQQNYHFRVCVPVACNMIDVHQTWRFYDFGTQNDRVLLLLQK